MHCKVLTLLFFILVSHLSFAGTALAEEPSLRVAMLIPGDIDDGGFMEAGYRGLMQAQRELGVDTLFIAGVKAEKDQLIASLKQLASIEPDMIIAHGGQTAEAISEVAERYPHIQFMATQSSVTADNLSSYVVLQEESAWLAGAAAGLLTESGIVGHISGLRIIPGLKGRGAFYNGLIATKPDAQYLTTFAGDQDDDKLAYRVAMAEIDAGADIIFTMLNSGRAGATRAMREKGIRQIGNVSDWVAIEPEVFVGSAVADVGRAIVRAISDLSTGTWQAGKQVQIGLDNSSAVRMSLADTVPEEIRHRIGELTQAIAAGEIDISITYTGDEFNAL